MLWRIACSLQVKHVIFPNTPSDNCSFTVCFEMEKWLFSLLVGKIATVVNSVIFRLKTDGESEIFTRRVGKELFILLVGKTNNCQRM